MKDTYQNFIKIFSRQPSSTYLLLLILPLLCSYTAFANNGGTPLKNTVDIPAGKGIVSSVILEAEDDFDVENDGENPDTNINTNISLGFSEALSSTSGDGRGVILPDQVDAISIEFNVDDMAAEYVINVRVRSGTTEGGSVSMENGYAFSVDGGARTFTLNNASVSPLSPNFGGSYFGVFESDDVFTGLAVGTHTLEISMVAPVTFGVVDYIEIVKIADNGTFTPATPAQVQNVKALVTNRNKIDIGWSPVSGADGYEIEFSTNGGTTFSPLATLGQFEYYYAHTGLMPDTEYTYRVRATRSDATTQEGPYSTSVSATTFPVPANFFDVNQIATLGDDLALGTIANGVTTQNLVFNTGILTDNGTDFIGMPLGGDGGMTISAAYHTRTIIENGAAEDDDYSGYEILGTVAGLASGKLADLAKGQVTYNKLITQITEGRNIATGKALSYKFQAVNILQGDSDAGTDTATYRADLVQLVTDLNTDINSTLGTSVAIPVFVTQSSDPLIAVAQYRAARQSPNLYIAAPGYFTNNATEAGRSLLGHYAAKPYQGVAFGSTGWTPVSPSNIVKVGDKVTIEFNVPVEPLVIDETIVTNPGNAGFELFDEDGQIDITGVAVVDGNKVEITASRVIGGNARVEYASSNATPRGNIRDSDTQAATFGGDPLYNWAVAFEENIANTAPEVPTGFTATPLSDEAIQLEWDALAGNVGTYTIEVSESDSPFNFSEIDEVDKSITDFEHTGLNAETAYYYRLKANNLGLSSLYSDTISATTLPVIPDTPTNLTATTVSSTEIDLSWDAVTGTFTGYVLERSTENTDESFVEIATLDTDATDYSDTGLTGGTTYFYRIKAVNSTSSSPYSNVATADTEAPAGPTGLTAEASSSTTIDISWDAVSGTIDNYVLESSDAEDGTFTELATIDAATTSFVHDNLMPDMTVFYRLKTVSDGISSEYSSVVSATTLSATPDAPTNLTATTISTTQIDLSWTAPAAPFTGFELESSDSGEEGTFTLLYTAGADETSYSHTGLTASTTFFYRIKAINNAVSSEYSATASATTEDSPIGEPTNLISTGSTDTQISISWTAGTGDITEYVIESSPTANVGDFVPLDSVSMDVTSFDHTGLSPDTTIFYRVIAINQFTTSAPSNVLEASTLPATPNVPANFTAVASSTDISQVNLSWDAVTENVDGYIIEEATSAAGPFSQIAALGATETSFVRTVDSPGQTYFYRIKATNGEVSSEFSTAVSVVTAIDEALFFGSFNVYPNPSNGIFNIELSAEKQEKGLLKIFNTAGKVVFRNTIDSNFNDKFDFTNFEKGLYIIDIETKSYRQIKKLLIN